jgi:ketosteroid isomerase-like protein
VRRSDKNGHYERSTNSTDCERKFLPEHRNALLVKRFHDAFADENWRTNVAQWLDHDVVWHVAGDNPLAGAFVGIDAVVGAMQRYSEHSHGSLMLDTRAVFADDEHAIAVHSATVRRGDFSYRAHETTSST